MKVRKHHFEVICDNKSEILILGSLPSVVSEQRNFYYAHSKNRFWKVIGILFDDENLYEKSNDEKKQFMLENHIALYDVITECSIKGSSDSSIDMKTVKPCDLNSILIKGNIKHIFLNGKMAYKIFERFFSEYLFLASYLPSTSPANAKYSLNDLINDWKVIKKYIKN